MRHAGLLVLALLVSGGGAAAAPRATSCTICHENADVAGAESPAIVAHEQSGVHQAAGLSCHDCHGGNPDPALADSLEAMDEQYAANPFRGTPKRAEIPAFCGRCHSDPAFMKRFKPDARVDQEREYWTSRHGELLQQGDVQVATCIDCHGTHGMLRPADVASPVHPKHVAETCSRCHSDATRMAAYRLPDGQPVPVDQYARWRQSVHADFLLGREDLSAPTCNDCHGNHGAQPPGLESVAFVCGQCHAREAELFRASPKKPAFEGHAELMADASEAGCADCHDLPQAPLRRTVAFTECTTCHGNHGIARHRSDAVPATETPCEFCHEPAGGDERSSRSAAACSAATKRCGTAPRAGVSEGAGGRAALRLARRAGDPPAATHDRRARRGCRAPANSARSSPSSASARSAMRPRTAGGAAIGARR
jgi:hypothetical protein